MEKKYPVTPKHDYVLLLLPPKSTQTEGGLHLPQNSKEEEVLEGAVALIGPEAEQVEIGEYVLFNLNGLPPIEVTGEDGLYILVRSGDIVAKYNAT